MAGPYRGAALVHQPAVAGRRIPTRVRLRLLMGGLSAQAGWLMLALGLGLMPLLLASWRDDGRALLGLGLAPAGAIIAAMCWLRGRRVLALLARGKPTLARLLQRKHDFGAVLPDPHNFVLTFEYRVEGSMHQLVVRTDDPEGMIEEPCQVCYHPTAPEHARLMAELPGELRIGDDDQLQVKASWGLLSVVLPVLGLFASAIAVLWQVLA